MGLFSSKETYVSSSVYNLAGDEANRPNFMASTIMSGVLSGSDNLSGHIQRALTVNAGTSQKRFFRWARDEYALGMPVGRVGAPVQINNEDVVAEVTTLLNLAANETVEIISIEVDDPDVSYWAEEWILTNRPELGSDDWVSEFDPENEAIWIDILGEPQTIVSAPPDLLWGVAEPGRRLLFVGYRKAVQDPETLLVDIGSIQLFTYRIGTGQMGLDGLVPQETAMAEFYPAVPLRLDNQSIRDVGLEDTYAAAQAAVKKLTRKGVDDLLDELEDNEDLADIDYCFLVLGVSLNSKDKAAKAYLYSFFKQLIPLQQSVNIQEWRADVAHAEAAIQSDRWLRAHDERDPMVGHPSFNTPKPTSVWAAMSAGQNELRVNMAQLPSFDFRVAWSDIRETLHVGNAKRFDGDGTRELAKPGEYWLRQGTPAPMEYEIGWVRERGGWIMGTKPTAASMIRGDTLEIYHQYAKYKYRKLTIENLQHINYVYGKHTVITNVGEALNDAEESGFLLPLHYPTMKGLGLSKTAQLATASSYLVFNSYKVVKKKWYQTGLFRIILAVAGAALAAFTGGASLGASIGLLGSNAAIGLAVGASVGMAAIVGTVVNSIAAMILTSMIRRASVAVFGDKLGSILGTIITFVAMSFGTQFAATGNFDVDWGRMFQADNLLDLTNSVSGAYTQWLQADTMETYAEMEQLAFDQADQLDELNKKANEILGMTGVAFDPMMLTDAVEYFGESSGAFLGRTLLTGSDIAELSMSMIENFSELSLELPRAVR